MDSVNTPIDDTLFALSSKCGELLLQQGWRVTTAESCTGGWVAQAITSVAGSADWFECGFVTYANRIKQQLLKVPAELLEGAGAPGAVSEETVRAMVRGALKGSGADCAIATTGIAGPGGGSKSKPVGTVWIGWACRPQQGAEPEIHAEVFHFDGAREAVRRQTVARALEGLLALLQASLQASSENTG